MLALIDCVCFCHFPGAFVVVVVVIVCVMLYVFCCTTVGSALLLDTILEVNSLFRIGTPVAQKQRARIGKRRKHIMQMHNMLLLLLPLPLRSVCIIARFEQLVRRGVSANICKYNVEIGYNCIGIQCVCIWCSASLCSLDHTYEYVFFCCVWMLCIR